MLRRMLRAVSGLALMVLLGTAGCNTIQGAGEDMEAAGEKIQEAAE